MKMFASLCGAALLSAAVIDLASAQAWPTKPVRIVIGIAPGGGSDLLP